MGLFALGKERTPSIMCYDHMARASGGTSTLLMVIWLGQWVAQAGLAAAIWIGPLGGLIIDGWNLTSIDGVVKTKPDIARGIVMVVMILAVLCHYAWTFGYRRLGAKITMGLDTSIMVFVLITGLEGGAGVVAWCGNALSTPNFVAAVVLFVLGLGCEWRADEELHAFVAKKTAPGYNGPKVMTTGMRTYSRHPGLVGFLIYWAGLTLLSGTWYMPLITCALFVPFIFLQVVPAHEHHMMQKYGHEWEAYVATTSMYLPHPFCKAKHTAMVG